MAEPKVDYRKDEKALYAPKNKPVLVEVPAMTFIMVDGAGEPQGADYQAALSALYALSFTIKFSKKGPAKVPGYFEYAMPPLEGLWELGPQGLAGPRGDWRWTSLIRQPAFVTPEVFAWAMQEAARKKPEVPLHRARLETFHEGLCVQIMHTGPYATEPESIEKIAQYMAENDLKEDMAGGRRHHEIYLTNPQRTKPERLKTILRVPVK